MAFTRQFLGEIYHGCDGHCFYCGISLDPFSHWEAEHMIPRSHGGSDDISNLVLACRKCNRNKSGRSVEEYRLYLMERICSALEKVLAQSRTLPNHLVTSEIESFIDHLIAAANYASVASVFFYGEVYPLPRDEYAPQELKRLDDAALDDAERMENLSVLALDYLMAKREGRFRIVTEAEQ